MKRKWIVTPMFLLFSAVLIGFACFSFQHNKLIFYIELFLSVISMIIVFLSIVFMRKYISDIAKSAVKGLSGGEREFLDEFSFPVAVTGEEGDILWINDNFARQISIDHTPHGEYITNYLNNNSLEKVFTENGLNVVKDDKKYTVFASKSKDSIVFYFIDDTELKDTQLRFKETRPCVVTVVFDNREEFERESDDNSVNSVVAPLESLIVKWSTS